MNLFAPFPALPAASQPLRTRHGVNVHFFNLANGSPLVAEQELDMLAAAGIRAVRLDLLWREVEKRPGVYDFRRYDPIIRGLIARGIRPMVILGLGNPLYAPGLTLQPAPVAQAFQNYAMAAVRHYAGLGLMWDLVNEPNHPAFWQPQPDADEYMAMVATLLPWLKRLDPGGFFVAPATAGAPLEYLERCFQRGLLNWVDGVSIHPYQAFHNPPPANRPPENFLSEYQAVRALVDRYSPPGKTVPVVLGEWGYSSATGELDEQTQADYAVRHALLGMLVGTPVNIWYNWKSDILGGNTPTQKEHQFGLVRSSLEPKPAYWALRELAQALDGLSRVKRLPSRSQDFLLLFSGEGRPSVVAAWSTGTPHPVLLDGQLLTLSGRPALVPLPKGYSDQSPVSPPGGGLSVPGALA